MSTVHWVRLNAVQAWHAWPHGGEVSACVRINGAQLRMAADRDIALGFPRADRVCAKCVKLHHPPYTTDGVKDPWLELLARDAKHRKYRLGAKHARTFSEMLRTLGPPDHPSVQNDFAEIKFLLLTPRADRFNGRVVNRLMHTDAALKVLAVDPCYRLLLAADAMRSWRSIVSPSNAICNRPFDPAIVLTAIYSIFDLPAYIQFHSRRGQSALSLLFHPNTLAWSSGITPGSGASYAEASSTARATLNIVKD